MSSYWKLPKHTSTPMPAWESRLVYIDLRSCGHILSLRDRRSFDHGSNNGGMSKPPSTYLRLELLLKNILWDQEKGKHIRFVMHRPKPLAQQGLLSAWFRRLQVRLLECKFSSPKRDSKVFVVSKHQHYKAMNNSNNLCWQRILIVLLLKHRPPLSNSQLISDEYVVDGKEWVWAKNEM